MSPSVLLWVTLAGSCALAAVAARSVFRWRRTARNPVHLQRSGQVAVDLHRVRRHLQAETLKMSFRHDERRVIREGRQEIADLHHRKGPRRWNT